MMIINSPGLVEDRRNEEDESYSYFQVAYARNGSQGQGDVPECSERGEGEGEIREFER